MSLALTENEKCNACQGDVHYVLLSNQQLCFREWGVMRSFYATLSLAALGTGKETEESLEGGVRFTVILSLCIYVAAPPSSQRVGATSEAAGGCMFEVLKKWQNT